MNHASASGMAADDPIARAIMLRERLKHTNQNDLKTLLSDFADLAGMILRNAPFEGCDLRGQDLRGLDFSGANLIGARFTGARIAGARFDQARVARWQLREAVDWREHVLVWRSAAGHAPKMVADGDRFSDTPFSPEMILIAADRDADAAALERLFEEERSASREGRLAVAMLPVTTTQYAACLRASDRFHDWQDDGADRPQPLSLAQARHYLDWLRRVSAADYRIPSAGLWRYLAQRGGLASAEDAVTVDSHRGLRDPLPADTRSPPGRGRCNWLGLLDMIGNVREFVLAPAVSHESSYDGAEKVRVIGGSYDESFTRAVSLDVYRRPSERENTLHNGLRVIRLFPPRGGEP